MLLLPSVQTPQFSRLSPGQFRATVPEGNVVDDRVVERVVTVVVARGSGEILTRSGVDGTCTRVPPKTTSPRSRYSPSGLKLNQDDRMIAAIRRLVWLRVFLR